MLHVFVLIFWCVPKVRVPICMICIGLGIKRVWAIEKTSIQSKIESIALVACEIDDHIETQLVKIEDL